MEPNFLESVRAVNSWKGTKFRGTVTDMISAYLSKIVGYSYVFIKGKIQL